MKKLFKMSGLLFITICLLLTSCTAKTTSKDSKAESGDTKVETTKMPDEIKDLSGYHEISFGFDSASKQYESVPVDYTVIKMYVPENIGYAVDEKGKELADQYLHCDGHAPDLLRDSDVRAIGQISIEKVDKDYVFLTEFSSIDTKPSPDSAIGGSFITDDYKTSDIFKTANGYECFTCTYEPSDKAENCNAFVYVRITDDLVFRFHYAFNADEAETLDTIINTITVER